MSKIETISIPGFSWEATAMMHWDTIQRVRELARKFEAEDGDGKSFLQYGLAAERIYTALDGEQS